MPEVDQLKLSSLSVNGEDEDTSDEEESESSERSSEDEMDEYSDTPSDYFPEDALFCFPGDCNNANANFDSSVESDSSASGNISKNNFLLPNCLNKNRWNIDLTFRLGIYVRGLKVFSRLFFCFVSFFYGNKYINE